MDYPGRVTVGVVIAVSVAYVALALALAPLPVPGSLPLAAAVTLPLALLFGPAVGWGIASGVVVMAALRGSPGTLTLAVVASVLVVATLGPRLWGALPRLPGAPPTALTVGSTAEYVVVALVTSAAAAATLGWGFELLAASPFHLVAAPTFLVLAAGTLVLGPPTLTLAARIGDRLPARSLPDQRPASRASLFGALLAPTWLVAGVVASLGFRVGQTLAPTAFTSRGLGVLLTLLDPALVGQGGRRVQVLLGAVSLVLVGFLVTRPPTGTGTATEDAQESIGDTESDSGSESAAEPDATTTRGVTDR